MFLPTYSETAVTHSLLSADSRQNLFHFATDKTIWLVVRFHAEGRLQGKLHSTSYNSNSQPQDK